MDRNEDGDVDVSIDAGAATVTLTCPVCSAGSTVAGSDELDSAALDLWVESFLQDHRHPTATSGPTV